MNTNSMRLNALFCKLQTYYTVVIVVHYLVLAVAATENYFTTNSENFESVPTTVKTYENDTVLLPCYSVVPYQYVRWLRDDVQIVDSRHPEIPPPARVTLFNNGSLQVRNVQVNDTAEYLCEVLTNTLALESQLHAIEVQYPPKVISKPSGKLEVKLGSVFEIVCEASGIPQPIISWRHNGRSASNHLENNRRRLVEVRNRDMAGMIECIATNGVGQSAVAGINMVVLFPPEVKPTAPIVHTKLSLNAHLECQVTAQPQANVHWFHHGIPVVTDNRISRQDHAILLNQTTSEYYTNTKHILIIKKIKETDFGMYDCRAENALGITGAVVELTGRPMPPVFKKSPLVSTYMTHNLIWQTESLSPIFEHKLRFRQVPSGNITPHNRNQPVEWVEMIIPAEVSEGPIHTTGYTLRGLMPASVYEVVVVSRNRFGWSDNSRTIRFATSGEIEMPNYSTESVEDETINDDDNQNYFNDLSSAGTIPETHDENFDENQFNSKASHNHIKMNFLSFFVCICFVLRF